MKRKDDRKKQLLEEEAHDFVESNDTDATPEESFDVNAFCKSLRRLKIPTLEDYPELKRIIEKYKEYRKAA
ncbi:MAG: hypothetical protein JRH18_12700 [Deltaproteobacteria bacterium]|nr:hypothetical protein [Deltaproteobacteria bacterium]MBW1961356.1 hypothetical protein [Deltaproteobacteria bacterium]MBW2152516.1 hypothetical protein [Deltaproteobacteria bacterium]